MTEQERTNVVLACRARLTGDAEKDIDMLQQEVLRYEKTEPALAQELVEIAHSLLSPEQADYLKSHIYLDGKRLDQVYAEADALTQAGKYAESEQLTRKLYEHILVQFKETAEARFFSFRNRLESELYHQLFHPTKQLLKAPFDFARFIGLHAYNLVELRRTAEALPVLERAVRYDPVNPDPRFEIAEVCKLLRAHDQLLEAIRQTLPLCTTPYAFARCYANMGFYCVEVEDYPSAVCFYYESLRYEDHPAIPGELRHVAALMGHKIVPPTRDMILDAFAKYDILNGPGRELLYVATTLGEQAMHDERWAEGAYYYDLIAALTHDAKATELFKVCASHLEKKSDQ